MHQDLRPQQIALPYPTNMFSRPNILCCYGMCNGWPVAPVLREKILIFRTTFCVSLRENSEITGSTGATTVQRIYSTSAAGSSGHPCRPVIGMSLFHLDAENYTITVLLIDREILNTSLPVSDTVLYCSLAIPALACCKLMHRQHTEAAPA